MSSVTSSTWSISRVSSISSSTSSTNSWTSPLDTFSELPKNVIENILMRLPLKEAVRTSILSSKWRYKWVTLPQLVFDYPCSSGFGNSEKAKLVIAVYQALLVHEEPVIKFSFSVPDFDSNYSDVNHWLHFLSKNGVQDFTLRIWRGEHFKLPCHLYSFQKLRHLNLHNCVFKPPAGFKGFDMLVSLEFRRVIVAAERFGIFISNCPLLERLTLENCPHFFCLRISAANLISLSFLGTFDSISLKNTPLLESISIALTGMAERVTYFKDRKTSNLADILSSVPAIKNLYAQEDFFKFLAIGSIQKRLPTTLVHLAVLHLSNVSFDNIEEVSCALCLIRSSPNLQKITIRARNGTTNVPVEYLRVDDHSDCSLNRLSEVTMLLFSGIQPELHLLKFLLATSPVLIKVEILPLQEERSITRGFQILRELIRLQRASPKAEILYLDPVHANKKRMCLQPLIRTSLFLYHLSRRC